MTFRKEYREPTDYEKQFLGEIKDKANELLLLYNRHKLPDVPEYSRGLALAKTKLEESVMWAVKGIMSDGE